MTLKNLLSELISGLNLDLVPSNDENWVSIYDNCGTWITDVKLSCNHLMWKDYYVNFTSVDLTQLHSLKEFRLRIKALKRKIDLSLNASYIGGYLNEN